MAIALVNCNFPAEAVNEISKHAKVFSMPRAKYLPRPVSEHPDMIAFVGFGHIVCHKDYYENNNSLMDSIASEGNLKLIVSDEKISEKYPHDAIFNACQVGKFLFCNEKNISRHILDTASKNGAEIIHVNQGYTKCSMLIVGDNDIITSDRGIHTAAQKLEINSLLIGAGSVSLEPYEYGFIGGATGKLGNKIFFCGELEEHPDRVKIQEFISSCDKECIFLPFDKLTDMGSILFIQK